MLKKRLAVLTASVLVVLSVSAASAAGSGLFAEMAALDEYADKRLPVLDTVAESPAASLTMDDGITVEVDQAYYEGDRVFAAYRMSSNAELIELHEGAPEGTDWTHVVENWITGETLPIDQADYMKEHDWLNGQGQRWLEGPYDRIDGIVLEDGTKIRTVGGMENKQKDGTLVGWLEAVVPEGKAGDTLAFGLSVARDHAVKFQDHATFKENWQEVGTDSIPFTLTRSKDLVTLEGAGKAGDWEAKADVNMGKVDMLATIRMTSAEQAQARNDLESGAGEIDTDLVLYWSLYRHGQPLDVYGENRVYLEENDEVLYEMQFPLMEDISGLSLVPEYARTGAHTDEAIVIETNKK